jgi:very-short-patch-repair endonuclease
MDPRRQLIEDVVTVRSALQRVAFRGASEMLRQSDTSADPTRQKAIGIFRYLGKLEELRAKTVRDVAAYEQLLWFSDLPRERECYTPAWANSELGDGTSGDWLRLDKPRQPILSSPSPELLPWLEGQRLECLSPEPRLRDEIDDPTWTRPDAPNDGESEMPTSAPPRISLRDHPEIAASWESYIKTVWRAWAKQYDRWQRVQGAYRKLFAIYQEQQRRGEQYELVVGIGFFVWISGREQTIRRPILTAAATIELESVSGRITVGRALDGGDFRIEQDMLEIDERPPVQDQQQIENDVSALESLWDRPQVARVLKAWLQSIPAGADSIYHDLLERPERATRAPQMAFAPVLMLRRRGARTMLEAIKKVTAQLDDGGRIPAGIHNLCELDDCCDEDRAVVGGPGETRHDTSPPQEVLFPLPWNDEQIKIVHRLARRQGVLVQGPPGTGKSHTIVNLLCNFLAQGMRVLVTSKTPRALKVLQDKIPAGILPLAVSLLGDDAKSRDNLELSVRGILSKAERDTTQELQPRIDAKMLERQLCVGRLSAAHRRLRELRETEAKVFSVAGTSYSGTPQAIAQTVSRDTKKFEWLQDAVSENAEPPLNDGEIEELSKLWEQSGPVIPLMGCVLPAVDGLPTATEFEDAAGICQQANGAAKRFGERTRSHDVRRLAVLDNETLKQLCETARKVIRVSDWFANQKDCWIDRAKQDVFAGRSLPWQTLERATAKAIQKAAEYVNEHGDSEIELPPQVQRGQLLADANKLLAHFRSGGGLGFGIFRSKVVRRSEYLWKSVRLNGQSCNSLATLELLVAHLTAEFTVEAAWREWADHAEYPKGTLRHRLACLQQCRNTLGNVLHFRHLVAEISTTSGDARIQSAMPEATWGKELLANCEAAIALSICRQAESNWDVLANRVLGFRKSANTHPELQGLFSATEQRDAATYREQLENIKKLHNGRRGLDCCLSLDARLRAAAPLLADTIKNTDSRAAIAPQLPLFTEAWAFKRVVAWLHRFLAEHTAETASQEIVHAEKQLLALTEELAALKAWKSCLEKLDRNPAIRSALVAWQQAVAKIAGGHSKYVERYRRDAREYFQQSRAAIPAWIMPLHRVVEQVNVDPEVFDVVIVDEASQTGPEGLILQYLAKQCIIVGDDKQISPISFVNQDDARTLMEQFLETAGVPNWTTLSPETSLFDQAAQRYGSRVTLREHFRCMPEIIRFSNDLSYVNTPLIPLRQYPPVRLPPVRVRFVTDGYREGRGQNVVNRQEAAAVAKTVIECLEDPQYERKSFGVISLQGDAQAKLIESMILERVGPDPFNDPKRRLLCGNAYSFQGDERDVVFLSLVASLDGEARTGALVKPVDQKRFNVAASRARDQMWLIESIGESGIGDLHRGCMRRRLLQFCYNPAAIDDEPSCDRYESQFERDVGEGLKRAGFRVIGQFEFASKRIDLVVEDSNRRIAIECDGDEFHGPDKYDADMARQRMLERCGWKFIRIRGSAFYANPERALAKLIEALSDHAIRPNSFAVTASTSRDWIDEVSGNDCLQALEASRVAAAGEESLQQGDLFAANSPESPFSSSGPAATSPVTALEYRPLQGQEVGRVTPDAIAQESVTDELPARNDNTGTGAVAAVSASAFIAIYYWAQKNNILTSSRRKFAYNLGIMKRKLETPTAEQAILGERLLRELFEAARQLGFPPPHVPWDEIREALGIAPA